MRFDPTSSQLALLTLSITLTSACPGKGDDDTGTSESAGSSDTSSTGDEPTTTDPTTGGDEVCACIDPEKFQGESYVCAAGPCEPFEAICDLGGGTASGGDTDTDTGGDCVFIVDEAKLGCALDLLISGEEGLVRWSFTADGGFSGEGAFVQVRPGRQGLTRSWDYFDSAPSQSNAGVVPLKPADYFQGCKDMAAPEDRFDCMTEWSQEEPTAQCDGEGL